MALRKFSLWLVTLLIGIAGLVPTASAATHPEMELKMSHSGSGTQISVIGHNLNDMYAFDLTFQFDEQRLKFQRSSIPVAGFSVEPILKGNTLRIAHTKVGNVDGLRGDVELASLTFERISTGAASVLLSDVKLVDSKLDVITVPANIKVIIPVDIKNPADIKLSDISGHWAEANILEAVRLGFVTGYVNGTFKPQREVTRAEFAVMLVKALKISGSGNKVTFKDAVPTWAESYIAAATEHKLVFGYPDQTFRPNEQISREEMAAIVVRALNIKTSSTSQPNFADADKIAEWAKPFVAAAKEARIMQGKGNNQFAPKAAVTRAEAVTVILSVLKYSK